MGQVILQVPDEVQAAGEALMALVQDLKQKKSIAEDVGDVLPKLMQAASQMKALADDIKMPSVRAYMAYMLEEMVESMMAPVAAVADAAAAP